MTRRPNEPQPPAPGPEGVSFDRGSFREPHAQPLGHAVCQEGSRARRGALRTARALRSFFHLPSGRSRVFVFISHLRVPPQDHAALERHFRERARLVDDFPGFLYLQLLRPQAGEATHTFLTAWRDRAAFSAYMRSAEHAESHAREPGEIMGRTTVRHEAFEVIMDSRARPEWLTS